MNKESSLIEGMKKNFGFGCMRLPMKSVKNADGEPSEEVDYDEFNRMIDLFMAEGFNYFDTAHGYLGGKSEIAIRECLVKRYPRESYILVNKLSHYFFETEKDVRPLFESQLKACGVEYFDLYLMHAQTKDNFRHYRECRAYEQAFELKKEGKVKHVGLSFHDTAEMLEEILTLYPEIEAVQLQFNYLDYEDPAVQSRRCYEVCEKFKKPVIVMEPVKGGSLVNLPEDAKKIFDDLGGGSYASYAIRFAAGFERVVMVLSGVSDVPQMQDNLSYMKDFKPLDEREKEAVESVRKVFANMRLIPCTACRYCVDGCPMKISIPDLFSCMNAKSVHRNWNADYYYETRTKLNGKASACIGCGKCESVCPQHLPIRSLLRDVAKEFEK